MKSLFIFKDGTQLSSGVVGQNAIMSCTFTESVNSGVDIDPGSVCSACIEARIFVNTELSIAPGDEIIYKYVDSEGNATQVGIFIAEKPEQISPNIYRITAFDRMSLTDTVVSPWLKTLYKCFPATLFQFAQALCTECGLTLKNQSIPNGDLRLTTFYSDDLTGRQLLLWIAQACGSFCRCTATGEIEFSWYASSSVSISASSTGGISYMQGGLSYCDYKVKAVDGIQIKQTTADVGTIYPESGLGENTYEIVGNPFLATETTSALIPTAAVLYQRIKRIGEYSPCTLKIPSTFAVRAGDILSVTDLKQNILRIIAMEVSVTASGTEIRCTGNTSRNSYSAVAQNRTTLKNIYGKTLEIWAEVEGLQVTAKDLIGRYADLQLTVSGISTQVSNNAGEISTISQTVSSISTQVSNNSGEISTILQTVSSISAQVSNNSGGISTLTQTVSSLSLSVSDNGTSSTIKLLSGDVEISSATINITGFVTFTDLSHKGSTTINGENITTGYISADRIQGGTIDASKITVSNLSASSIKSGTLSADYISGGTIDASKITVTNLSIDNVLYGNYKVIDCSGTHSTPSMKIGFQGSGASEFQLYSKNVYIRANEKIYFGYTTSANLRLVFDMQSCVLGPYYAYSSSGSGSNYVSLGDSSHYFRNAYTYNLYTGGEIKLGSSSTLSKIGFFGTTPIAKKTVSDCSSSATLSTVITKLNALLDALQAYGLIGS